MDLKSLLIQKAPREIAGARTSKQYDYQKDLSLYLLLENHTKKDDYVFLFDFHEDLVMLDSAQTPSKIDCFQIKTKTTKGNWTAKALIYRPDGNASHLGKLYYNKVIFDGKVNTLNFVTNATFSLELLDKTDSKLKATIIASELSSKEKDLFKEKIKEEYKLDSDPEYEGYTFFKVSDFYFDDSSTYCKGKLENFFHSLNPNHTANVTLAYNQIFNEIRIKTAYIFKESDNCSWEDIVEKKGISKEKFDTILKLAGVYKSIEQKWNEIYLALVSAGVGTLEIKQLHSQWRTVNATILRQPDNTHLIKAIQTIDEIIFNCQNDSTTQSFSLSMLLNEIFQRYTHNTEIHFEDLYLKALILRQLYNE